MFGLGKRTDVRFWEALLANEVAQVRTMLNEDASLGETRPPARVCRNEEGVVEQAMPLHAAAARGYSHIVKLLLLSGVTVDPITADGGTPLHEAATCGQLEAAELLLYRKAQVNARDDHGRTPMHRAALGGHETMVRLLIEHGGRTDVIDNDGNTMLHCAAAGGCEQVVRQLLENGAEVNVPNKTKQRTPLHLVIISADHTVSSRVVPDRRDERAKMERIAQLLLEHGGDPNAVDGTGETPLDIFDFIHGDDETDPLVRLLRHHGGHWVRYHHRHQEEATAPPQQTLAPPTNFQPQQQVQPQSQVNPLAGPGAPAVADAATSRAAPVGPPIPLGTGTVTIGRQAGCDIRYRSRTLSRRHAQISHEHGEYIISDLGSHNGVVINDRRMQAPHVLSPGEKLTLGVYEFTFDGKNLLPLTEELSEAELEAELSR